MKKILEVSKGILRIKKIGILVGNFLKIIV